LQECGLIALETMERSTYVPQHGAEAAIHAALTSMPQSVSDLVTKASIEAASVNAMLTLLELSGAAKNVGGGMWVRR